MNSADFETIFDKMKYGGAAFHELMRWRVRRVLMVLPHYDAWILENDAKLSDQIVGEYHQLNLTTVPRLSVADNGAEALTRIREESFDMVVVGERLGTLSPAEFAEAAKKINPDLAILLLYASRGDLAARPEHDLEEIFDADFVWTGDSRLFLAMIKYVEDKRNAPSDTADGRVGVMLMVEDSISFYSACLPLFYGETMLQTQRLIAEEMNDADKYWRMRTRPKVLLARNWEEAVSIGETYSNALIGIVSDIDFSRNGNRIPRAGFELVEYFRSIGIMVPVLFQSSDDSLASHAREFDARFQSKRVNDLHGGIRRFILQELGFGDFIFRKPDGREITRARTLLEFEEATASIPIDSVLFHANRNDFSRWLTARGEYKVAKGIRIIGEKDFTTPDEHRQFLCRALKEVRESRMKGRLIDFSFENPAVSGAIVRYGSGSLGGKGRGLAFFNSLLNASSLTQQFSPISVEIPKTLIIATGEFDKFLEVRNLPVETIQDEEEHRRSFVRAHFPGKLAEVLDTFLMREPGPLAVRSSTLLEDSRYIPLAGVYETYMIPGGSDRRERLRLLCDAVKLVWSCVFSSEAVKSRKLLGMAGEEEKMAVVIQKVAGRQYGDYWFPQISGAAQSMNYYPVGCMTREDGITRIAIGMGKTVVDGEGGYPFCAKYPNVPWRTEEDSVKNNQTHFWTVRYGQDALTTTNLLSGENSTLERLTIGNAEKMGILRHTVSTWDPIAYRLVDGLDFPGLRVVDFRDILAYDWLPLAPLVDYLLQLAKIAMGVPVEMEFALDWKGDLPEDVTFSLLQVRPIVSGAGKSAEISACPDDTCLLLRAEKALGHGIINGITDVIWIDPNLYDPGQTEAIRDQIAAVMEELAARDRYTILIGPGRWGSRDRFLGIPVSWSQIRQSRLVVEVAQSPGAPEPSQGSHFFHNLVSLGVGYAHVFNGGGFVAWDKLRETASGNGVVRHSVFNEALDIVIDGRHGRAWVI